MLKCPSNTPQEAFK